MILTADDISNSESSSYKRSRDSRTSVFFKNIIQRRYEEIPEEEQVEN